MDNKNISLPAKIIVYAVMILFTVLTIYPLSWMILQSLKTNQIYMTTNKLSFPPNLYLDYYPLLMNQGNYFTFFKNSVIYSVVTVVAVVLLSNMAGFAFAKLQFKITKLLHGIFIVGILIVLQAIMLPLFLMVTEVGIHNTRLAVLIPYIALGLPMGVYLCTDFEKSIPDELLEAARIDGAGYMRTFTKVVLPMCAPVSVTLAIITFVGTWNEFILMNLMVSYEPYKAIPYMVGRYAGALGAEYGKLFTALTAAMIPILIFYSIFSNQITKGVAAGAVKG